MSEPVGSPNAEVQADVRGYEQVMRFNGVEYRTLTKTHHFPKEWDWAVKEKGSFSIGVIPLVYYKAPEPATQEVKPEGRLAAMGLIYDHATGVAIDPPFVLELGEEFWAIFKDHRLAADSYYKYTAQCGNTKLRNDTLPSLILGLQSAFPQHVESIYHQYQAYLKRISPDVYG